jgi:hypothetical protein
MGMRVEVSRRVRGVRLLLKKPFLEPINEGNMNPASLGLGKAFIPGGLMR